MLSPEAQQYIAQSRASGMPDDQIRQNLIGQGWSETDVTAVLSPATLPSSGVGNSGLIVRVILFVLIFVVLYNILQSTLLWLFVAYIPILNISLDLGGPGILFAIIYLPLATFLFVRKYKRISSQTTIVNVFAELFYFVFVVPSVLILILQLFYIKHFGPTMWFSGYSIGMGGLIIALLISSWTFFRNIKTKLWHALILLVIGLSITFWFSPAKKITSDVVNVDSSINNFVHASHYSKINKITILINDSENNTKIFGVSYEDPVEGGGTKVGGLNGLEHGDKIGWIDSYKKVKPEDENQRYHFSSSDDNLFSNQFLNKLGTTSSVGQKEIFAQYAVKDPATSKEQLMKLRDWLETQNWYGIREQIINDINVRLSQ